MTKTLLIAFLIGSFLNLHSQNTEALLREEQRTDSTKMANEMLVYLSRESFILLDVSQSMVIQDYEPDRLNFVKNTLEDFLTRRKQCDFGLVLFAGEVLNYNISNEDSCYSISKIRGIDFSLIEARGTAIGDAVWSIIESVKVLGIKGKLKKLIIISDGDITAGVTSATMATKMANYHHIKIHSIGIGQSGLVKLGKDINGNAILIEDIFTDKNLKEMALRTGGKYYWVKTKQDLLDALKEISLMP